MQISDRDIGEIEDFTLMAKKYSADVLYIADSTVSLNPKDVSQKIKSIKNNLNGEIGLHMHDNLGLALSNTIQGFSDEHG